MRRASLPPSGPALWTGAAPADAPPLDRTDAERSAVDARDDARRAAAAATRDARAEERFCDALLDAANSVVGLVDSGALASVSASRSARASATF